MYSSSTSAHAKIDCAWDTEAKYWEKRSQINSNHTIEVPLKDQSVFTIISQELILSLIMIMKHFVYANYSEKYSTVACYKIQ